MITSGFSLAFNNKALLNNSKEMLWERNIFQVTTSTDGHGSITATPMSGYQGTMVSLSNTPNANYDFTGYSVTGATLTGNQFTLNNDVTARAGFSALPEYTAKSVSHYYMSINASAGYASDVRQVKIREIVNALSFNLPYSTTAASNSFYILPTDNNWGTFDANTGLFQDYRATYISEYPGYYLYTGKYVNTSAFVSTIAITNSPWVHLNETATTRNVKLYASVNGSPMKEFVTFDGVEPGHTYYVNNASIHYDFNPSIYISKGSRITVSVYCPDTAVSANVANCMPYWYGTISGLK
jgi:hypothetical protein